MARAKADPGALAELDALVAKIEGRAPAGTLETVRAAAAVARRDPKLAAEMLKEAAASVRDLLPLVRLGGHGR